MRFWNRPRTTRIAIAVAIATVLACLLSAFFDGSGSGHLTEGDFPEFYIAGYAAKAGLLSDLYNPEWQRVAMIQLWPKYEGGYTCFVYPPFVAWFFAPFTLFSPPTAKLIYIALNLVLLFASVSLLGRLVPGLVDKRFLILCFAVGFTPLLSSILAGQNTPLSLVLLLWATYVATRNGSNPAGKDKFLVGIILGVWLFKPQFGGLAILLASSVLGVNVLAGASIPALIYFFIAAGSFGDNWVTEWLSALSHFKDHFTVNYYQMISISGFLNAVGTAFDLSLKSKEMLALISTGLSGFFLIYAAVISLKANLNYDRLLTERALWLIGPTVVLCGPGTLYYDLPIAVLCMIRYWRFEDDRSVTVLFAAFIATIIMVAAKDMLPISPLFLVALWSYLFVVRKEI